MLARVESVALTGPHGDYVVHIATPREAPPSTGYPVLYVLDANASFASVVESVRSRSERPRATGVVPAVVAGIGYPTEAPYDRERRRLDLTSGPPAGTVVEQAALHSRGTGGAAAFRRWIEERVKPLVESKAAIDRARQTIVGHSLAGLFVIETLLEQPASFEGYIAASPSLWWNRAHLLDRARALRVESQKRVVIVSAEFEDAIAPWQEGGDVDAMRRRRTERRMVDGANELASVLRDAAEKQIAVDSRTLPGEDHASTLVSSLGFALRFVLKPS